MPHPDLSTMAAKAFADARLTLSNLIDGVLRATGWLRQRLKPPVPARRAPRKQRRRPQAANMRAAPPVLRIDSTVIAELRALAKSEPDFVGLARQIVTHPEIAAAAPTLERKMAWLILRDQRRPSPQPGTAA